MRPSLMRLAASAALAAATLEGAHARPPLLRAAAVLGDTGEVKDAYDYIIVGAGTTGLTIADRLTEDENCTVLVIEYCGLVSDAVSKAGGGRTFNDPKINYNITSVPQLGMNGRVQPVLLGCCVGGSSAINGMVLVRGTASEYDGWAELGGPNSTWDWAGAIHFNPPVEDVAEIFNITWDPEAWGQDPNTKIYGSLPDYADATMIPMYNAMQKMPGVDTPLDGAGGNNGLFWYPSSMDDVKYERSYARTGHYDNIVTRPNFEVVINHRVKKVLFDGTTATGVQYVSRDDPDTLLTVKANKEVIISAGTIHTPQILQNSGVGPNGLLTRANISTLVDLPGVGQNFQDHVWVTVGYKWQNGTPPVPNITLQGDPNHVVAPNLGAWLGFPVTSPQWDSIASRYEAQRPAAFLPTGTHATVVQGYRAFQRLHGRLLRTKNANWLWHAITGSPGGVVMNMHILSHGTVNINVSEPYAEPIVDYRALTNPVDIAVMVENIGFLRRYLRSPDLMPYGPLETSPGADVQGADLEEWIRDSIVPSNFHPIGTAAKMPREMGGVVDEELFVYGTEKLRIADASIMPMLPGANTQQTCYMIGEKVADFIKSTQRKDEVEGGAKPGDDDGDVEVKGDGRKR